MPEENGAIYIRNLRKNYDTKSFITREMTFEHNWHRLYSAHTKPKNAAPGFPKEAGLEPHIVKTTQEFQNDMG